MPPKALSLRTDPLTNTGLQAGDKSPLVRPAVSTACIVIPA